MQTENQADANFRKLAELFPNVVTETIDENGEVVRAIDKDALLQEISVKVIDGRDERYQFSWPGKRKAILAANAPTTNTLRPCREESVNFDTTENLYIEGDNLEVLKLLQENYFGKVNMIYIDPPYNTGNDFVYEDDFAQTIDEYITHSGQYDEDGNRLVLNYDTNGRYHTDWLNMIYPRLKLSRTLLSDNGVIFISIDAHEISNLQKICDEIFGSKNCLGCISNTNNPKGRSDDKFIATAHEYILVYAKQYSLADWYGFEPTEEVTRRYNKQDENGNRYREIDLRKTGEKDLREDRPKMFYYFYYNETTKDFFVSNEFLEKKDYICIKPLREDGKEGRWRWGLDTATQNLNCLIPKYMPTRKIWGIMEKDYLDGRALLKPTSSWTFKDVNSERGTEDFTNLGFDKNVFQKPKPLGTIKRCIRLSTYNQKDAIILDFFSGSASTAHAVLAYNSEDEGHRKFIMVQFPEITETSSEAAKSGFKNICEIGKERIRRAGKLVKEESPLTTQSLDIGFRVLKLETSNMQQVWYTPNEYVAKNLFEATVDNVKSDRTPEDLLFQAMLELDCPLSSKIESIQIHGKTLYDVADGYLMACFEEGVTDEIISEIAQKCPYYFVMRDSSLANDSVAVNFEQIFKSYSPDTKLKVF